MTKVCMFHTGASLSETFTDLAREYIPDAEHYHIVDESVINDLLDIGELTPDIKQRITVQLSLAERGGADMILDTCSSTSPAVDVAREVVDIPIIKIDDPMAERAVELGDRIGVLATANSTLGPSTELVERKAEQVDGENTIESVLVEHAFEERTSGNIDKHDELVTERALELAETVDVIVLAQASMSHLEAALDEQLAIPVLSSPDLAMERIATLVDEESS